MRRQLVGVLVLAVAMSLTVDVSPRSAHAEGELEVSGTFVYTVDPLAGIISVDGELEVYSSDTTPRRCYSALYITVPTDAARIHSTQVGRVGNRKAMEDFFRVLPAPGSAFKVLQLNITNCLRYGEGTSFTVHYEFGGTAPRSDTRNRINGALIGFEAFATGAFNDIEVTVTIPDPYVVDPMPEPWQQAHANGFTTLRLPAGSNPDSVGSYVSAWIDSALERRELTTPSGAEFTILYWPGDEEWGTFVAEQISEGVESLERTIGRAWPIATPIEVRESTAPALLGHAGWFSASEEVLAMSERLDREVVLHELSHAWFNSTLLTERWVSEGFAQEYSNQALSALDGEAREPLDFDMGETAAIALNEWGTQPAADEPVGQEAFGYNASYYVVHQLMAEIGMEKMGAVLAAVESGTTAYEGAGSPEAWSDTTDWRRLLDLLQEIGGSTVAEGLFAEYVISRDELHLLADRATARQEYQALHQLGGDRAVPVGIRQAMDEWRYEDAHELMSVAEDLLPTMDRLARLATEVGVELPEDIRTQYESATDLDDLEGLSTNTEALIRAAQLVRDAVGIRDDATGVVGAIGQIGSDTDSLIAQARDALADGDADGAIAASEKAIDSVDDRVGDGLLRLALLVALVILVSAAVLILRRRRARHATTGVQGTDAVAPSPEQEDACDGDGGAADGDGGACD